MCQGDVLFDSFWPLPLQWGPYDGRAGGVFISGRLPEGQSTVGTKVDIAHTSATPVGMTVTARAELIEIDGKRLLFKITAEDDKGPVGHGEHQRSIIDLSKFMAKVEAKKSGV